MKKVGIIAGAGPAGLTAAFELLERTDVRPIVVEASEVMGGLAQTFEYKGNRMDIGGHRFFSRSKRVMDWWFARLPTDDRGEDDAQFLLRPRQSRIFFRHNFFPYPLGITLTVAWRLGLWNTLLIALSYIKAHLFPIKDETYLDAFFINRFGRRLYETFFRGYTEKVWGVPCSQIRSDWGAQRVKGLSLKRAIAHAVRDLLTSDFVKEQHRRETSLITRFYYPRRGPGQMWEAVADAIRERGGEIRTGSTLIGTRLVDGRVVSATVRSSDGCVEEIACDYLISSIPLPELLSGMTPAPPEHVQSVARGLRFRDFLTVGVLLRKLHVVTKHTPAATHVEDNWIYVQDPDVMLGRIQIFNNWSADLVADPAHTVWLGLEYFVDEGDALWESSDSAIVARAVEELEHIGFARGADVLDTVVVRVRKAYPAYFGSYPQIGAIQEYVRTIPNLFCVGRNGMHRYNNQDHSMLTAMMCADNIASGSTDDRALWDVNLEMVYNEEEEKLT